MIYILVIIALFAALTFVVARQSDTTEIGYVSREKIEMEATRILQMSAAMKAGIEQMLFTGVRVDDLDFVLPGDADFATAPHLNKVFHIEGGGLMLPRLNSENIAQVNNDPPPGIYIGRFNNFEWTDQWDTVTSAFVQSKDVVFVAHQIRQDLCEELNFRLRGSRVIPATVDTLNRYLIWDGDNADGDDGTGPGHSEANVDLMVADCPDPDGAGPEEGCEDYSSLCVGNGSMLSFYSILIPR